MENGPKHNRERKRETSNFDRTWCLFITHVAGVFACSIFPEKIVFFQYFSPIKAMKFAYKVRFNIIQS